MPCHALPKAPATVTDDRLTDQLTVSAEWRLNQAEGAVELAAGAPEMAPRTPLDAVVDACDQARRRSEQADLDAEAVWILIDAGDLVEARQLLAGRLAAQAEEAKGFARMAEFAANEMAGNCVAAAKAVDQVQPVLTRAGESAWQSDSRWLSDAITRVAGWRCRIAHAEEEADAARELAVVAAAHTVHARIVLGLATSDLEKAESRQMTSQAEAVLVGQGIG
ncbi:MAG: hypothetical protein LBJ02_02260 [Bifidobacteriaceae bacterium]|jgi:hypothetical protein|nr:hypothetical protein [Bifidobacteriaceae bacterium]